jgi:tRNA-splicing ligase RtcB
MKLTKETPYRFRIEQEGAMRVPGIVSRLPRSKKWELTEPASLPG